jgi:hypothetical protein
VVDCVLLAYDLGYGLLTLVTIARVIVTCVRLTHLLLGYRLLGGCRELRVAHLVPLLRKALHRRIIILPHL